MRTSIRIEDDAYLMAIRYAESNGISIGKAVSELIRRGTGLIVATKVMNGVTIFDVPETLKEISTEGQEGDLEEE